MRIVALLATVAAVSFVTACSGEDSSTSTDVRPRPPLDSIPPTPPDSALRDVRKAFLYNDGIAYTLDETAMQMVCGALSAQEWADVLGAPVGRTVFGGVTSTCVVDTGLVSLTLSRTSRGLGAAGERIGGRRVKTDKHVTAAAMVPLGERDGDGDLNDYFVEPVLEIWAKSKDMDDLPRDLPDRIRRLLTTLLPRLAPADKPATPQMDDKDYKHVPTDPVPGVPVYDLPLPLHSRVLCTAMVKATGVDPTPANLRGNTVGECYLDKRGLFAEVSDLKGRVPETGSDRIAGRAALVHPDEIQISLLRATTDRKDAADVTFRIRSRESSDQLRPLAEKVMPLLLP